MKFYVYIIFSVLFSILTVEGYSQTYTQTFIDKCTGETKIATTTMVNGSAQVSFYNQARTFTPLEVQTGQVQIWLQSTYLAYSVLGCPTAQVVQQTVTQAVTQTASSAASSSASAAASSSASSAATPPNSSSSTTSASQSSGSSTSETKTETKPETKSESKSEETKSENKSESKEESKSESKEETKEDKKSEKKEKKKQQNTNPMMLASDIAGTQSTEGNYATMLSVGVSKSSLMGDKSYSTSALIWSTLDQFALSSGVTKMDVSNGKLNSLHSYSTTVAYIKGSWMSLLGYTYIKPHPTVGTYGFNVGTVFLKMGRELNNQLVISTSFVGFWMKQYQYNSKLAISPQLFIMSSPIGYNTYTGSTAVTRIPTAMVGSSFDYKLSKRFGFGISYRANMAFETRFSMLNNFLVGSKMVF